MIIQSHLKSDKFCFIGVMNSQKKIFFNNLTNQCIKMSYYQFNRQDILQKSKDRYGKKEAAEYYSKNKEEIKEKSKNWHKNFWKQEKDKVKEYQRKIY